MKKGLYLLMALMLALLFPAAFLISRSLPANPHGYISQKYAEWNGVLHAWVCTGWKSSENVLRWLNECASVFEKQHPGVYIEFSTADVERLNNPGQHPPELIFFSPGKLSGAAQLIPFAPPESLRDDLRSCGAGYAQPVAMGGYIWVYNPALTDSPPNALPLILIPDDEERCFSAALVGLTDQHEKAPAPTPEPGIDLGLPANAATDLIYTADALQQFIDGSLSALPVTQKELARLNQLQKEGRGPDWKCAATGSFAYTDQLVLGAAVRAEDNRALERTQLSMDFLYMLYEPQFQDKISNAGLFSVTGNCIYPIHSPLRDLDALLNSRRLITPLGISEYSIRNGPATVRSYLQGEISAGEALANMLLKTG